MFVVESELGSIIRFYLQYASLYKLETINLMYLQLRLENNKLTLKVLHVLM